MPSSDAKAVWSGDLKSGEGNMSFAGYEGSYTFLSRFETGAGEKTNPEQLIAAAHAGCFSMALSGALGRAGFEPTSVNTTATVTISKQEAGFGISEINLVCRASVPGIEAEQFQEIADGAKKGCPVSRALAAVETITLDAQLV